MEAAAGKGGGERSKPIRRMLIMSYDTESKSRNVLASPLGEEATAKVTVVRMIYDTRCERPPKGGIIILIAR